MTVTTPNHLTTEEEKIKRPANPFMLFRSYICSATGAKGPDQGSVSKQASKLWKGLSPEEKAEWEDKADMVKKQHALDHPDYKLVRKRKDDGEGEGGKAPKEKVPRKTRGKAAQKNHPAQTFPDTLTSSLHGRHFIFYAAEVDESGTVIRNMSPLMVEAVKERSESNPRFGMEALAEGTGSQTVRPSPSSHDSMDESTDSEHSPSPSSSSPSHPTWSKVPLDPLPWSHSHSPPLADPAPRKNSAPTLTLPAKKRTRSSSKADGHPRPAAGLTGIFGGSGPAL